MKCPKCGQELEEGAKFCNNCGEAVLSEPAEIEEEKPAEEAAEAVTEKTPAVEVAEAAAEETAKEVFEDELPEETEPEKKHEDIKSHRGQLIMTAEEAEEVERKALERRKDRKKANKALRWILLVGVVIACFLTFNNAPDARVKRVVNEANEAESLVEAGDYNGAMDKYIQALEFRPGNEEISQSANDVLQEVGMNMTNNGQYEEMKELCDKVLPLMAPDQQYLAQLFGQIAYISLEDELVTKGDVEGAKALIQASIFKANWNI